MRGEADDDHGDDSGEGDVGLMRNTDGAGNADAIIDGLLLPLVRGVGRARMRRMPPAWGSAAVGEFCMEKEVMRASLMTVAIRVASASLLHSGRLCFEQRRRRPRDGGENAC